MRAIFKCCYLLLLTSSPLSQWIYPVLWGLINCCLDGFMILNADSKSPKIFLTSGAENWMNQPDSSAHLYGPPLLSYFIFPVTLDSHCHHLLPIPATTYTNVCSASHPLVSSAPRVLNEELLWWTHGVIYEDPTLQGSMWVIRTHPTRDKTPHTLCKIGKCSMNKKKKIINTTMQSCICIAAYILYWVQQCPPKFMSTQNLWLWPY